MVGNTGTVINAEEYVNDWFSDDESEPQLCNDSNLDTQPAHHTRTPQRSQLRPAENTLPFSLKLIGFQTKHMSSSHPPVSIMSWNGNLHLTIEVL
jgi:hypothetical protein